MEVAPHMGSERMSTAIDPQTRDEVSDLVRRAQEGDRQAFAALYETFYARVSRYVSFKTGGSTDAEDIVGEVFVRMFESIHTFRWQGYPFSSWLFRIAHNLVVDYFRKTARQKTAPLDTVAATASGSSPDLDGDLDRKLAMQEVRRAMVDLTDLQREVITLRFTAGLSVLETSKAVGKRENAVKALQHAGIRKLRRLLAGDAEAYPRGVARLRGSGA